MSPTPSPDDLTVHEVAAMTRSHPSTVSRWIRLGILPGYRLRGTREWRVKATDVTEMVEDNS